MNGYEEEVLQNDTSQKMTPPSQTCMDSDDLPPSWISPRPQSWVGSYPSNLTHPVGPQDQKFYSDVYRQNSFPLGSSVVTDSDSCKFGVDKFQQSKRNDFLGRGSDVQHGFLLGRQCLSEDQKKLWSSGNLRDSWSTESIGDEDKDSDIEDPNVTDIYKSTGDIPGALLYKTETGRRAMSQKIGSIGHAGQNLGLGHILGCVGDDSTLIPSRLQVLDTCYVLDEASPVQTDIRWCPPGNASRFQRLVYEFEFCDITSQTHTSEELRWCPVATVHHPLIRVYRSESCLLLGRCRLKRAHHDTVYKLRVRAVGRLMGRTGPVQMWIRRSQSGQELSHSLAGEWSSDVYLTWVGWDNQGRKTQLTSL